MSDNELTNEEFDWFFAEEHGEGLEPSHDAELLHLLDPDMPSLQEGKFCINILKGMSKKDAYIQAFDKRGDEITPTGFSHAASRLMKRPRVARRLAELRHQANLVEEQSVGKLVSELDEARELAKMLAKPNDMIAATKAKADLMGHNSKDKGASNNLLVVLEPEKKDQLLELIVKQHGFKREDEDSVIDGEIIG